MAFLSLSLVVGLLTGGAAEAATAAGHPCEQVKQACEAAGFVKGQAKLGSGLWKDCIDPLMQAKPQPANADKKLPAVDPAVIAACRAKRPKWGEGK